METINKTTNYKQFSLLDGNRDINRGKVLKLKTSLSQEDLTSINPIIVNEDFQIIDGQHRYTALKELGKPVYYIKRSSLELSHVQRLNMISSVWGFKDYLDSYCKLKNKNYIYFSEFIKKFDLTIQECLKLYNTGRNLGHEFKTGQLDFLGVWDIAFVKKVVTYLDLAAYFPKTNSPFIYAFRKVYNSTSYDHKRMMNKLSQVSKEKLILSSNLTDQLRVFEDIYNFNTTDAKMIRFY